MVDGIVGDAIQHDHLGTEAEAGRRRVVQVAAHRVARNLDLQRRGIVVKHVDIGIGREAGVDRDTEQASLPPGYIYFRQGE